MSVARPKSGIGHAVTVSFMDNAVLRAQYLTDLAFRTRNAPAMPLRVWEATEDAKAQLK